MHADTVDYNESLAPEDREICNLLAREIDRALPEAENKIWHAHPVWFLDGNPVVGYSTPTSQTCLPWLSTAQRRLTAVDSTWKCRQ